MSEQPSIVAFSGHLTDAPERPKPRFPESHVPGVRARVRHALAQLRQPVWGVSSAARGGDLIFIEELLALGGNAHILLPFPAAAFKHTSVGQGWDALFDRLIQHPRASVQPALLPTLPPTAAERDAAFAACNERIVSDARGLAQLHGVGDPLFLAVYQRSGSDLTGGTHDAFGRWTRDGGSLQVIEP